MLTAVATLLADLAEFVGDGVGRQIVALICTRRPWAQAFAQRISGFTDMRSHRRFACLASRGHTELAGVRIPVRDALEDGLEDRGVQVILGR